MRARSFPGEMMESQDIEALLDGFEHVESVAEFRSRVALGRPLRVKLGIDPTSPDLHLGFMVVLEKLQRFANAGHAVTLIIGDFTARIGDPSGKNAMRPQLSADEIDANMRTYREQAGKVLDLERVTIRYNSEWLGKLGLSDLIGLLSKTTVAQMLERNDFDQRYSSGTPISLHEFLYPVAQAYDSIAVEADMELGGTDQLFNLLLGRHYQREFGQTPQICATVPLLVGLDGVKKMSKSIGNYVGIAESAESQFGKLMSIADELMPVYARLAAFRSRGEADALAESVRSGAANPMQLKKELALDIVARYHGRDAAQRAREHFEATVQRREAPTEMPELRHAPARLSALIVAAGFAASKREAERLLTGSGVKLDGIVIAEPHAAWNGESAVLSVGSRKFVRLVNLS